MFGKNSEKWGVASLNCTVSSLALHSKSDLHEFKYKKGWLVYWFYTLYCSKLSVVFLSIAFKAIMHEKCFPLLYKCVHQHLGSDSLFFLTPADRGGSSGCILLTWRVSYCPRAPCVCPDFLEDLHCLHVSVSPFSSQTIGVQVERKPILWELDAHIPAVQSNQLKDIGETSNVHLHSSINKQTCCCYYIIIELKQLLYI